MTNIKGSASGKPNIIVYTANTAKTLASSEFTASNTKIIYGLDANRNILSYTPGQSDFLQGFLSLENNKGYYAIATSDFSVTGIVPVVDNSSPSPSPSPTPTPGLNPADFNPASVGVNHQWSPRIAGSFTQNGSKVTTLNDVIGTANISAALAQAPDLVASNASFNNRASLRFTAANSSFLFGAYSLTVPFSLFLVIKREAAGLAAIFEGGAVNKMAISVPPLQLFNNTLGTKNTNLAVPDTSVQIISFFIDDTSSRAWVAGGSGNNFGAFPIGDLGGMHLGFGGGQFSDVSYAEVLTLPGAFTASAHNYVGSYLAAIYGASWSNVS